MSSDGHHGEFAPQYEVMARIKTAFQLSGRPYAQICADAGKSTGQVQQAFEQFDQNPQLHLQTLICLELALQISEGALTGREDLPLTKDGRKGLLEKTLKLMWQYIYKATVPRAHWAGLEAEVRRRIASLKSASSAAMYRAGVPATWQEVGQVYHSLLKEGRL